MLKTASHENTEALSRTSGRALAPFLMPLRRGIGWDGIQDKHFEQRRKVLGVGAAKDYFR